MLIFLLLLIFLSTANAKLVASVVIPHGDFCYDPSLVNNQNGSLELHNAAVQLGAKLSSMPIDFYILTTPHGLAMNHSFAIYLNSNLSGFAHIGDDLHNDSYPSYNVYLNASSNQSMAVKFVNYFMQYKEDVQGIMGWADSEPMPLRWGEVIALSFVNQSLKTRPVITLTFPTRRNIDPVKMIPELLQLGSDLFDMINSLSENVAIIISSDLAHTHQADGPYGYSPAAEPFDRDCGAWAGTLNGKYLTEDAAGLVKEALSCGYTGLVTLHGALERAAVVANKSNTDYWNNTMLYNAHPTYYGMMVASFFPK